MAQLTFRQVDNLTVCVIEGQYTTEEIRSWVSELFTTSRPRDMLWDFTRAETAVVNAEEIKQIAIKVKELSAHYRKGCKTAFVATESGLFNLLCMYTLVATMEDTPVEQSVFRSREEAFRWLGVVEA